MRCSRGGEDCGREADREAFVADASRVADPIRLSCLDKNPVVRRRNHTLTRAVVLREHSSQGQHEHVRVLALQVLSFRRRRTRDHMSEPHHAIKQRAPGYLHVSARLAKTLTRRLTSTPTGARPQTCPRYNGRARVRVRRAVRRHLQLFFKGTSATLKSCGASVLVTARL